MNDRNADLETYRQQIDSLLRLLAEVGDCPWLRDCRQRLVALRDSIAAQLLGRNGSSDAVLMEWISILEGHPTMREARKVVWAEEKLQICRDGIAYYGNLRGERELDAEERSYLQTVEYRLAESLEEFETARREFLQRHAAKN